MTGANSDTPPISDRRIQTFCLVVLTIIALAVSMFLLKPVLVPFTLALFGAIVMSPLVNWLVVNVRIPKWLALLVAMLIGVLIFLGIGAIVTTSVAGLTANKEAYAERITTLGTMFSKQIEELAEPLLKEYPQLKFSNLTEKLSSQIGGIVQQGLLDLGGAILGLVSEGVLVLIFLFFLMAGDLTSTQRATGFWGEVETRVKNYLIMKVMVSSMTGIGTGVILALLGVDLAMTFGVLAFALNFIPNIGSAIATCLPLPIVILAPDATIQLAVLAVVLPGSLQMFMGNVIEPKLLGDSLDLHPVVLMMALIFFGMIWGIVGMLLAAPIAAIIKIVLDRIDVTRPFAELMAGRMIQEPSAAAVAANTPSKSSGKRSLGARLFGDKAVRKAAGERPAGHQKMKRFGHRDPRV